MLKHILVVAGLSLVLATPAYAKHAQHNHKYCKVKHHIHKHDHKHDHKHGYRHKHVYKHGYHHHGKAAKAQKARYIERTAHTLSRLEASGAWAQGSYMDYVEDRWDRREDRIDHREDRWDRRHNWGPGDRREDRWDRREDRFDRWEDRWD